MASGAFSLQIRADLAPDRAVAQARGGGAGAERQVAARHLPRVHGDGGPRPAPPRLVILLLERLKVFNKGQVAGSVKTLAAAK